MHLAFAVAADVITPGASNRSKVGGLELGSIATAIQCSFRHPSQLSQIQSGSLAKPQVQLMYRSFLKTPQTLNASKHSIVLLESHIRQTKHC